MRRSMFPAINSFFQLAAEMNKINNHDKNLSVDFIPWYQQQ